jgi:diguanylate cyclase (GGDEF)-like protein
MVRSTYTLTALGFTAILGVLLAVVFISLSEFSSSRTHIESLADISGPRNAAIQAMRSAVLQRDNSLRSMQRAADRAAFNQQQQRFGSHTERFRKASTRLAAMGLDNHERAILGELQQLDNSARGQHNKIMALLGNNGPATDVSVAQDKAAILQAQILGKLDELQQLAQQHTQAALAGLGQHQAGARRQLFTLTGIALLLSMLVSWAMYRHLTGKDRQLAYFTSHDSLTGLINRREFERRVDRSIEHAKSQNASHALLYMDLDQFKVINDTCGHAAGDELLQQLAQLLRGAVRQRDTLGRLGGDEFGMLLENCPLDKAVEIANGLLKTIDAFQFSWDEHTFTPRTSIGVVPIDRNSTDIAGVMSAADAACYIAKESGRNQVQIAQFGDRRLQQRRGEMQWVSRLTRTLEENRFALYFQPIMPCASRVNPGRHVEILLRLIADDGTIIRPGAFLPAAEKYNLAAGIDRWVITNTMQWLAANTADECWPVTVSINLSRQTLAAPDMLRFVIDTMDATGISPEQVIFEVAETAVTSNITQATSFMLTLRGCGFRFTLDDFGSGLSSFTYLKKLPVDFLKIDGTLIRDMLSDPVDYAMVRSINELGQLLGKDTVAKHVETMETAEVLRRLGVNHAQGNVYARAEPLNNFVQAAAPRLVVVSS